MENTIINRSSALTGMERPLVVPKLMSPMLIRPVKAGARFTIAPVIGLSILFGVADPYNCAVIVMEEPISDNAVVVLKKAVIAVIVPSRGTEKAKLVKVPAGFVMSIVGPRTLSPGAELPKPTNAGVPARPPRTDVKAIGRPEASGMMAPAPGVPGSP